MASRSCFSIAIMAFAILATASNAQPLDSHFYDKVCPAALPAIRKVVEEAVAVEPRMGASLLRLHFHDCFVNGCDGSILLDDTPLFTGEKKAAPNVNSFRGFDVIDRIKDTVNAACRGNVVSCADVVAVAARDSVVALGGPPYDVLLGRRDSRGASQAAANNSITAPTFDLDRLVSNFASHGLTVQDLVLLSGSHTLGFSRCTNFRDRLYNETATLDASLAAQLGGPCSLAGGDDNLAPLDPTPARFDGGYYGSLLRSRGLLHSDQQLFSGGYGVVSSRNYLREIRGNGAQPVVPSKVEMQVHMSASYSDIHYHSFICNLPAKLMSWHISLGHWFRNRRYLEGPIISATLAGHSALKAYTTGK